MDRKKTSIKFDETLWKEAKKHCIDANLDVSEYLERLVRENLHK